MLPLCPSLAQFYIRHLVPKEKSPRYLYVSDLTLKELFFKRDKTILTTGKKLLLVSKLGHYPRLTPTWLALMTFLFEMYGLRLFKCETHYLAAKSLRFQYLQKKNILWFMFAIFEMQEYVLAPKQKQNTKTSLCFLLLPVANDTLCPLKPML